MNFTVVQARQNVQNVPAYLSNGKTTMNNTATNFVYRLDPLTLRLREHELDRELLNRPSTIAQRIECELIKNLERSAPYLLPNVLAAETPKRIKN